MDQNNQNQLIIKNNILYLAKQSGQAIPSQRNLLNKWFQDSIKTYIFESYASPLIADYLKLKTSTEVKAFIHKKTDKNKPKYMGIIEQYFIYLKQCNKQDAFINKLQQILLNPEDITSMKNQLSYNTMKTVRKQFVCLLILKYFELFGQQEMSSFYDLWNICFPQELQVKKKLSRFDKKSDNKDLKSIHLKQDFDQDKSLHNLHTPINFLNRSTFFSSKNQSEISNQEIFTISTILGIKNQYQVKQDQSFQISNNFNFNSEKKPINNRIFEEESYEEESMNHYLQFNNFSNSFQNEQQQSIQINCDEDYFEKYQNQQEFFNVSQDQQCFQQQGYYEDQLCEISYPQNFHFQQQNNNQNMNQINQN
ncbi:hypothetical protein TTHERM_00609400 (macronuclear) [Tetrahymena thermophila SB210]|uniref:Uncharacterized protein n=1 Tax=Tetrahymena thermophila (strain SB210) TaxID=312017 RepID=Q22YE9_TETTS|nr:hypothetical protein TTHERM_00609400 [Tetrahymena thermophila SB210]EAR90336.1 hypothetical protein TTHERM_00609400 [Tetrahymena thermophila SB210]|eukprot:XP_001010581.1 hypothetical protein TTHERM_00609400 [Tetrahymena thermophila SB210]